MQRVSTRSKVSVSRASSSVVVGRMRAEEELWQSPHAVGDGTTAGTSCIIDVLRVRFIGQTPALEELGRVSLSWEPGAPLGEPLERLGWRSGESVVLAIPTPAIAGGAIELKTPTVVEFPKTDMRERIREAQWRGREQFLEAARRFFDSSLERIEVLTEDIQVYQGEDGGSAYMSLQYLLRQVDGTPGVSVAPMDLPETHFVLLPLVLGEYFHEYSGRVSLLIMEEERLTYVSWHDGQMEFLRSFPLGAGFIFAHVMRTLACSPHDARILLAQADDGTLSPDAQRLITKALRPLFPLFGGLWRMLEVEYADTKRPTRCAITGYWPTLLWRIVSRTAFQSRCLTSNATLYVLPRVPRAPRGDAGRPALQGEPSRGLLDLLASAVLAHQAGNPRVPNPVFGHRGRAVSVLPAANSVRLPPS